MTLSKLGQLEQKIRRLSRRSKQVPSEFLESELKRFTAIDGLRRWWFRPVEPESIVERLEREFKIYFEPEKTKLRLIGNWNWKHVYAGSNGQIEFFLCENNFTIATTKMGFGYYKKGTFTPTAEYWPDDRRGKPIEIDLFVEKYRFVKEVKEKDLPERVKDYFIGIGYLYPNDDGTLTVHGNSRLGQNWDLGLIWATGNNFLSRDNIRIPYHETNYGRGRSAWSGDSLNNRELWKFWGDLLALELTAEARCYYSRREFRRRDKGLRLKRKLQEALDFGHCLVPQRYVCKEPKIEDWGWNEDCLGKYLPRVLEALTREPTI